MLRHESQPQIPDLRLPIDFLDTKTGSVSTTIRELKPTPPTTPPWSPESWRLKPAAQAVEYNDPQALDKACSYLSKLPPLISHFEIEQARIQLYHVALGRAFIIQGGDCAESFHDVRYDIIRRKVELLREQSQIIEAALSKPVITVGRIAGQYAKPRSRPFEILPSGEQVFAFRGHIVNSEDPNERAPDPNRLLLGYFYAAASQNTIRHLPGSPSTPVKLGRQSTLYTSHEALHLPYESALTRDHYNLSATTIWLGERTRQLDGAHAEYARGLRNPIGVKIGPATTAADVVSLLDTLAPDRSQHGKVTIITRMGQHRVRTVLPPIIRAVQLSGHIPIWMSDPCHANTFTTPSGAKSRRVEDMLVELKQTYLAHKSLGSHLGGVHLEQTGDNVTECLDTHDEDVGSYYQSLCDPRLSREQALTLVEEFADFMKSHSQ